MASIVLPPPMESTNAPANTPSSEVPTRDELIKRLRAKCAGKNRGREPAKDALASQLTQALGSSEAGSTDACPQLIQTLLAKMGTKKVRRNPLGFAKKVLASLVQSASPAAPVQSALPTTPATEITMVPPPPAAADPTPGAPVAPKPRRRGNRRRAPALTTATQWLQAHSGSGNV